MDREMLDEQIAFVQKRIEAIDEVLATRSADEKGYKELVDSYNKWVDRYSELLEEPDRWKEADFDFAKLDFEREQLEFEKEKSQIERDRLEFEKEKFEKESARQKEQDIINVIFEGMGVACKIAVPVISLAAIVYVANLSYMNDSKLELCNGRIMGTTKDLFKILTMKV